MSHASVSGDPGDSKWEVVAGKDKLGGTLILAEISSGGRCDGSVLVHHPSNGVPIGDAE